MATITDPIMLDSTGQDIKDQISALNTKIQTLNTLLADLGLVSITPISQEDYDALSQAEKLAGVFDIYDAVEPDIDGTKVSYDSNTSVVEKIDDVSKAINPSNVSLTLSSGNNLQINKIDVRRNGEIAIIFLRLQATAQLSANTEIEVGTFSGLNYIGHIGGAIVSNTDTSLIGGYAINASNKLYVNFTKTISQNTTGLITIPCFVTVS